MDLRRSELGDFLRSRRERLDPEALGLRSLRRRRTPGLRREEVAERAGIGVDWYVRLEQGRTVRPSAATLAALARALALSPAEQAHLRALAGADEGRRLAPEIVPDVVRRALASIGEPAYVTGRRWDLLAWNAAAAEIFGFRESVCGRNILYGMLVDPGMRALFGESWEGEARRMVAQFRATHDLWADDPAFVDLVRRLRAASPEFARWWGAHDVRGVAAGRKTLTHPVRGALRYDYASFQANDDPGLKLVIYAPA